MIRTENDIEFKEACPECGQVFYCGRSDIGNCFCNKLKLTDKQRAELSLKYNACLCSECLEKLLKQEANLL